MNEIVGTLYYVLANDLDGDWAEEAEDVEVTSEHAIVDSLRLVFGQVERKIGERFAQFRQQLGQDERSDQRLPEFHG